MSATWMLCSMIVTILLALAAMALERVVALYRGAALRGVWVAAAVASIGFMAVRLLPPRVSPAAPAQLASTSAGALDIRESEGTAASVPHAPGAFDAFRERLAKVELPRPERSTERTVFMIWGAASCLLAILVLVAAWRLRRERDDWTRADMAGTSLLLSPNFGPAIVGVVHPEIVVPQWINELDEPSRRAIVAHEAEHVRAHDPALLLAGLVVVVLLPWNIGLWMCWRGMRRTIELDCDARVLERGMERADYANVLLGAWQRARSSWMPSPAFAERASGLGKRVEHLMRTEPRRRAVRTFIGVGVAALLVLIACAAPSGGQGAGTASGPYPLVIIDGVKKPEIPWRYRYTGAIVAETTTTPTFRVTYKGPQALDTAANKLYPKDDDIAEVQVISAPTAAVHFGPEAKYGAVLFYTKKYREAGGAILVPTEGDRSARRADPGTPPAVMAQRIFDRMFNGISFPAGKQSEALAIIGTTQAAQEAARGGPILVSWPRLMKLQDERDAALRALLTTDADRTKFDAHSAEQPRSALTTESVASGMFNNLFTYDTIMLSKDAESKAHAIIKRALVEEVALYDRAPGDFDGRIAIRNKRDAELRTLLTSDRDRMKFDVRSKRTAEMELKRP